MTDEMLAFVVAAALLGAIYKVWSSALEARELANKVARETCAGAVVQFLDGTVAFSGIRIARDSRGKRALMRTYTFDYTRDGFERAQGFVVLTGGRLEAVGLAGAAS